MNAQVVCRQLGFTGGIPKVDNEFGAGYGPIWMDDVECTGTYNHTLALLHHEQKYLGIWDLGAD